MVKGLKKLGPFFVTKPDFMGFRAIFQTIPENVKKLHIVDNSDKNTQYCVIFANFTCVFRRIIYNMYDGLG